MVTLVPAESYFDPAEGGFSRDLSYTHSEWEPLLSAPFPYHGKNAYAYLVAAYGLDIFEFVTIQLYESYTHANFNITQRGQASAAAAVKLATLHDCPQLLH